MKRVIRLVLAATALSAVVASPVVAHDPTCSGVTPLGISVHGQHVIRDYVIGMDGTLTAWPPKGQIGAQIAGQGVAIAGGPGPGFHFEIGFAPGASFCNSNSKSPGFHVP